MLVRSAILFLFMINLFYCSGAPSALTPFFRLFNGKDHFYTTSMNEANTAAAGGYTLEGTIGRLSPNPTDPSCKTLSPLYRLYNGKDHFYTTSESEAINAGKSGYHSEGTTGYCVLAESDCDSTLKLNRFYFPSGDHFYTTNEDEAKNVMHGSAGPVTYEGITCYLWN